MKIDELRQDLTSKKAEARKLLESDVKKAEEVMEEVRELQKKISMIEEVEAEEMRDLQRQKEERKAKEERHSETRALENLVLPGEKFEKRSKSKNLKLDKLVRGMAGAGWTGAENERAYYRDMTSAGNSTIIPQDLFGKIIDTARTQSALLNRIPTVPMQDNNMTVAVQTQDPVASFTEEGELIKESGPVFSKVTMEGKTLAIFVPVSEQLLDSAENLEDQLMNSCSKAIALALDKALIYGAGTGAEIKGISSYDTINKITHVGDADYDMFIKAIKETKKANVNPTDIVYSTSTGVDLALLKDKNGQYISKPAVLEQYTFTESNNVKTNESYVFDYNSLLLGIHKNITMEWGTSADQFQRIVKGLRIYLRTDLAIVNPKGITQITLSEEPKN